MPAQFDCHLTELDDATLAELSDEWQQRAIRDQDGAQGIAQVLEAELLRRQRMALPPAREQRATSPPPTSWLRSWRFGSRSQSA
jgi:hypothetical protein